MSLVLPKLVRVLVYDASGDLSARAAKVLLSPRAQKELGEFNFDLRSAHTAEEALNSLRRPYVDLILVELRSSELRLDPGKNQFDFCKNIRAQESARRTGVIFLIAESNKYDEMVEKCFVAGADDVLRANVSDQEFFARVAVTLNNKIVTDQLRAANHRLQQLSYTDELTHLANMRAFNAKYSKAVRECEQGHHGLGVIMLDLDYFKQVNDTTNHLMGSHVLAEIGRMIRTSQILDADDCAARFGGDEYVIFTRDPDVATCHAKAEEIRRMIEKAVFIKDGQKISLTTSAGVSWTAPGFSGKAENPIKGADLMLYKSKELGRNCTTSMVLSLDRDLDKIRRDIHPTPAKKNLG